MSSTQSMGDGDLLSMLLSVLSDVRQELARVAASNTELRDQVRKLTEKVEPSRSETKAEKRARLEPQAIALLMDPEMQLMQSRIAERLGVAESTLNGWKRFRSILEAGLAQAEETGKAKYAPKTWPKDRLK